MSITLAIDPGVNAAVALVKLEKGTKIELLEFPMSVPIWDEERAFATSVNLLPLIHRWVVEWGIPDIIVIEKVHSMPEQGVASTFKFGLCTGVAKGALEAYFIERGGNPGMVEVNPAVWKRALGLTKEKKTSLALARTLFGRQYFPKASHHNEAEAALMGAHISGWRP